MRKKRKAIFYILSVSIPAVAMTAALIGLEVTPFGENSLVMSDGNSLYLNYLGYISQTLKREDSFLFSFTRGLGSNMAGSWRWFFLNPFFVLFSFCDITKYLQMYTLVSMLYFCGCGLTMYLLLQDLYGHKGSHLIFSTAYALNGFLAGNVLPLVFFSALPLLPLMVMGLIHIFRDKSPVIYVLTAAWSLLTDFHFGCLLLAVSFLAFTVFLTAGRKQMENRRQIAGKYILSSFFSTLLSSAGWLPALLSLRGEKAEAFAVDGITVNETASTVFNERTGILLPVVSILAAMFLSCWMYKKASTKNVRRICAIIGLILLAVNIYLNFCFSIQNISRGGMTESDYRETIFLSSAMTDAVRTSDGDFYRMEVGEQRPGTIGIDPMLYGYYGVGHSGTDASHTALSRLGVHRSKMRTYYGRGISSPTDSLLGIRYLISKEDLAEEKSYKKVFTVENLYLYLNPYALPVAFLAENETENVRIESTDVFENLNDVWTAISGSERKVFSEEHSIRYTYLVNPAQISWDEDAFAVSAADASLMEADKNEIMFTWTADRDGAVYTYNGFEMKGKKSSMISALNYVGYYHKGEIITGYLPVESGAASESIYEEITENFHAVYVNEEALAELSQIVSDRPATIEKRSDTHLCGRFTAEEGQLLMFTIPYDEGWTLFVDGRKTGIKKVLDIFMAADVEPGEHTYEMKFMPLGLKTGALATGFSLVLMTGYVIFDRKKRNYHLNVRHSAKGSADEYKIEEQQDP